MNDKTTLDGVPVKVGDRVWRCNACRVYQVTVSKLFLGMWWDMIGEQIWSTEAAALDAAITDETKALKKAKAEVRRATKAIERLTARRVVLNAQDTSGTPSGDLSGFSSSSAVRNSVKGQRAD